MGIVKMILMIFRVGGDNSGLGVLVLFLMVLAAPPVLVDETN